MKASILGCALLLASGGAWAQTRPEPAHTTLEAGRVEHGASVYLLDAELTDQDGRKVKLADFRGQPVLISMFYGYCPYACPMLMTKLKRLEAALTPEARTSVRVVLVSLDPARDTPESLKKLAGAHGLDASRWRLLWTREENVQELAAVLGIKYRALPNGQMNHSSVITLLDREGLIDQRLDGLDSETDALVSRLNALSKRAAR
jgi:protein SCO1/2